VEDSTDNRLKDGGGVSLTRQQPFTPMKIRGTHFCRTLSRPESQCGLMDEVNSKMQ
jgi:hypothetical protein